MGIDSLDTGFITPTAKYFSNHPVVEKSIAIFGLRFLAFNVISKTFGIGIVIPIDFWFRNSAAQLNTSKATSHMHHREQHPTCRSCPNSKTTWLCFDFRTNKGRFPSLPTKKYVNLNIGFHFRHTV